MSIFHFNLKSKATGRALVASAAYITGETVKDEKTGEFLKVGKSERVMSCGYYAPESMGSITVSSLLQKINDHAEICNEKVAAKVIEAALPEEYLAQYSHDECEKIMKEKIEKYLYENFGKKGFCFIYGLHTSKKNAENIHFHALISRHPVGEDGQFVNVGKKKEYLPNKKQSRDPETGDLLWKIDKKTGTKIPEYRVPKLDKDGKWKKGKRNEKLWIRVNVPQKEIWSDLKKLRADWAMFHNANFTLSSWIDARSNSDRGMDALPTIHEGYVAREIEEKGKKSDRCEHNRLVQEYNDQIRIISSLKLELQKEKKKNRKINLEKPQKENYFDIER